jgi:Mce-associated membrane protein
MTMIGADTMIEVDERPSGTPDDPAAPRGRRRALRRPPLLPTLVALVAALAVVTAVLAVAAVRADGRAEDEARALAMARQTALNLTSTDPASANASFAHLQEAATGRFAADLSAQQDSFVRVIQSAGVDSTGTVSEAGIQRLDGDQAEVVVIVDATVKNTKTPDGEPRQWRMHMDLQKQADGQWLVSGLDFVA